MPDGAARLGEEETKAKLDNLQGRAALATGDH